MRCDHSLKKCRHKIKKSSQNRLSIIRIKNAIQHGHWNENSLLCNAILSARAWLKLTINENETCCRFQWGSDEVIVETTVSGSTIMKSSLICARQIISRIFFSVSLSLSRFFHILTSFNHISLIIAILYLIHRQPNKNSNSSREGTWNMPDARTRQPIWWWSAIVFDKRWARVPQYHMQSNRIAT